MLSFKKLFKITLFVSVLCLFNLTANAQKSQLPVQEIWQRDYQPFRIAGNLYYVGTFDLACYLITTPQGHILINTGLEDSGPMIKQHVEALGFKFNDIKILLATHVHYDHAGALAWIKKETGAKLMIEENDAPVVADGGNSDFLYGGKGALFPPVKADKLLHDQEVVKLGDAKVAVLHHPGHTKGACSFLFDVKDDKRSYKVLIANMPTVLSETKLSGMPTYPNVGKDYAYTLKAMKDIKFDIWLASHASQFDLEKKHQPGDGYNPQAFFDQKGYDAELSDLQQQYDKRLNDK
ncbi:subclass B3 metallo-beta-lactamase [Mucilaginibacter sp. AW1-3]